jgi:hypothetical protein
MLEVEGTVSYSNMKRSAIIEAIIVQAGLKAYINFGDVKDDVISYSSASTSSGGGGDVAGCVHHQGTHQGAGSANGPSSGDVYWENNCYSTTCKGKNPGTLQWSPKNSTYDEWTCSKCSTDYDCMTGLSKTSPPGADGALKKCSSQGTGVTGGSAQTDTPTASTDATGADTSDSTGATDTTDTSSSTASASQKTYWEMVLELTTPTAADLQVFVWMDTCYVQAVPDSTKAVLQIDETRNIIYDTIDIKEGDPTVTNTVIVTYGSGNNAHQVVADESVYEQKYGEITDGTVPSTTETVSSTSTTGVTKVKVKNIPKAKQKFADIINATKADTNVKITKVTQSKMNLAEATAYAWTLLGEKMRDDGFEIDLSVIGHPDYYVCRWVKMVSPQYNVNKTYYIDKIDHKFDLNNGYYVDLTLLEYRPTMQIQQSTSSGSSGSSNPAGLDAIMQAEGKFRDVQGVCSAAACLQSSGEGDCWADSYWLFAKLSAAGIKCRIMRCGEHRFIQINTTGSWVEYDYAKYANPTAPHGGSARCHVPASVFQTSG